MAGALTHILVGLVCLGIVHLLHMRWEFSFSVFIGNLAPDAIRIIFTAIKQGTLALFSLEQDAFYSFMARTTNSVGNWLIMGFFVLGTSLLLYHFHVIQEKKMEEYDELYVFLLIGIIIHLILDALIIETSAWI